MVVSFESRRWFQNGPNWGVRRTDAATPFATSTKPASTSFAETDQRRTYDTTATTKRRPSSPTVLSSSTRQEDNDEINNNQQALDTNSQETTVQPSNTGRSKEDSEDTIDRNKSIGRHWKRRDVILSSAAALLSSVLTTVGPSSLSSNSVANAATSLSSLEDSEVRRIEVFERNAPSVVFIDTFAEKQDVFSPNVMEVPLGTGSGFVYDKEGHVITNYHVIRNAKFAQVALITPRTKKGLKIKGNGGGGAGSFVGATWNNNNNNMVMDGTGGNGDDFSSSDIFSMSPSTLSRQATSNRVSSSDYQRTVFKATVVGTDPGKDIAVLKIDAPPELLYPIQLGTSSNLRVGQAAMAIGVSLIFHIDSFSTSFSILS